MNFIPSKTPALIQRIFPKYYLFNKGTEGRKEIFLTFDDGPIPEITEFVLDQLERYAAKATFFCIGDNIKKNPAIFKKIITAGHAVGNHTMNHMKAWQNNNDSYIKNILDCADIISKHSDVEHTSLLFRPPYGQISYTKFKKLQAIGYKIILWDVLSKDYDTRLTPQQCVNNVITNICNGSIIVLHDSKKAFPNLQYTLPKVLDVLSAEGYSFKALT
ncbi:polysaccharide deacetylase family protein [Aquimarina sp. W85]|uniref:polysaccharide deacetylase family protein n=1 Tax=Aquimarina rhodophyticola TaxID=3342246 RepID=UPI003671FBF7